MKHTKSLKLKIKNKFANKFAECRFQPRTLEQAFSLALDLEKKIQIADSFRDDIMDSRTPTTVNEVQSFPLEESHSINEISNYRNNNSNNHGQEQLWQQAMATEKQQQTLAEQGQQTMAEQR